MDNPCCWYHAQMSNVDRYKNCKIPPQHRCNAMVKDCRGRSTDLQCTHYATIAITVHGHARRLCVKHAEVGALAEMLRTGKAKSIPKQSVVPGPRTMEFKE